MEQVWLEIGDGVSVGIDRDEAMAMDRDGFAKLYREQVYPPPGFRARLAWRRKAEAWADEQIELREAALANR